MNNTQQRKTHPTPAQLVTIWANRAQKATTLQTTGAWHVRPVTNINPA